MPDENRLTKATIALMISTALFFDAIQFFVSFIPFLGEVISVCLSVCVFLTFFLWFKFKGIKFNNLKKSSSMIIGFLIELIPIIDMLPGWTAAVVLTIITNQPPKALRQAMGIMKGGATESAEVDTVREGT